MKENTDYFKAFIDEHKTGLRLSQRVADAEKVIEAARRALNDRGRVNGIDHVQTILNCDVDAMEHALRMYDLKWKTK